MSLIIHNSHTVFIDIHSLFVPFFFFFYQRAAINKSTISVVCFWEGSCVETQTVIIALLKQLNAVFFISAREPWVCTRNGFTLTSLTAPQCSVLRHRAEYLNISQDYHMIINCIRCSTVVQNAQFCTDVLYLDFLCACNPTLSFPMSGKKPRTWIIKSEY